MGPARYLSNVILLSSAFPPEFHPLFRLSQRACAVAQAGRDIGDITSLTERQRTGTREYVSPHTGAYRHIRMPRVKECSKTASLT